MSKQKWRLQMLSSTSSSDGWWFSLRDARRLLNHNGMLFLLHCRRKKGMNVRRRKRQTRLTRSRTPRFSAEDVGLDDNDNKKLKQKQKQNDACHDSNTTVIAARKNEEGIFHQPPSKTKKNVSVALSGWRERNISKTLLTTTNWLTANDRKRQNCAQVLHQHSTNV